MTTGIRLRSSAWPALFLFWLTITDVGFSQTDPQSPRLFRHAAAAGTRCYRPGRWSTVIVGAINRSDQPAEVLTTLYFTGQPLTQYGRRFWIPPHAKRQVWSSLRVPHFSDEVKFAEIKSAIILGDGSGERVDRISTGEMFHTAMIRIHHGPATGLIHNWEPPEVDRNAMEEAVAESDETDYIHESIRALRRSVEKTRNHSQFLDPALPPQPENFEALDHVVVANDRLAQDSAGRTALRSWLYRGGRLWVLLDKVQAETVHLLLGDDTPFHFVDEVELDRLRIVRNNEPGSRYWTRSFHPPLKLVRVLVTDGEVSHRIDDVQQGWPAAFSKRVGKGLVIFTTLDLRGWVRRASEPSDKGLYKTHVTHFLATHPLNDLAATLFAQKDEHWVSDEAVDEYLADQIVYRVSERRWVALVLGGFCVFLASAGMCLRRLKRLDHFWWLLPAGALTAAGIVAVIGSASRRAAPPTVAVLQWVRPAQGVEEAQVQGKLAVYHQQSTSTPLGADRGGLFTPDLAGLQGSPRRLVWTDLDRWRWENLSLPAGVRTAPFRYTHKTSAPLEAHAQFGPQGLQGQMPDADFRNFSDGLIACPLGASAATPRGRRMQVRFQEDGSFLVKPSDLLSAGAFIQQGLLSDEQRRRQRLYRKMFRQGRVDPRSVPTLFAFADPLDMGFTFDPTLARRGAALLEIPLRLQPTPPETRVSIPAPFIEFSLVKGPGEQNIAPIYNRRTGEWLSSQNGVKMWFRFQFPAQVIPLELEDATLHLRIEAPSRTITLQTVDPSSDRDRSQVVDRDQRRNPSSRVTFPLQDREVLRLDDRGGLVLGLAVSHIKVTRENDPLLHYWKMDQIWLEARGVVAGGPGSQVAPAKENQ